LLLELILPENQARIFFNDMMTGIITGRNNGIYTAYLEYDEIA
jgi:hypothetical protein